MALIDTQQTMDAYIHDLINRGDGGCHQQPSPRGAAPGSAIDDSAPHRELGQEGKRHYRDARGRGRQRDHHDPILSQVFDQEGLRTGIEEALRELARHSPRRRHRYTLVDLANSIRPPSWM